MPSPTPPTHSEKLADEAVALALLLERHSRQTLKKRLLQLKKRLLLDDGNSHGDAQRTGLNAISLLRGSSARRSALERCRARYASAGVTLLHPGQSRFPVGLAGIPDAPLLLYCRGELSALTRPAIAIVGARRASRTGLATAERLAADLADAGAAVVSGLALGVDAAAHRGALAAGGATIAVLGSGVNRIQPIANTPLARQIVDAGGLILSEYPLGTPAAPFRFPERNRLISGLSAGVVVVEASERSGSLITARLAAEQGREVMAVPGAPGYANSAGVNRLLKTGAALIETAADILRAIGAEVPGVDELLKPPDPSGTLDPAQLRLLDLLDGRAQTLDGVAALAGLGSSACAVALTELELAGFVQRVTGGYIRRPSDF